MKKNYSRSVAEKSRQRFQFYRSADKRFPRALREQVFHQANHGYRSPNSDSPLYGRKPTSSQPMPVNSIGSLQALLEMSMASVFRRRRVTD